MGTADEQTRVSNTVKRELEKRKREGESYNDVLERVLGKKAMGDFYDGFGRWSEEEAQSVREAHQKANEKRKENAPTGREQRMKVLDASVLTDYLDGIEESRDFYESAGGDLTHTETKKAIKVEEYKD